VQVEETAAAQREGGQALVRDKVAALADAERNSIRNALLGLEHA
jgi:hypothetical protein